jgi:hypothetical protein
MDNYRCYLDCLTAGLVKSNGQCVGCSSICLTCSLTMTNCTSCDYLSSNPYYFNFKCLSTCYSTYFNDNSTYNCTKCTSPCESCLTGSTTNSCITCVVPYILSITTINSTTTTSCLSSCQAGYYLSGYQCVGCVSPCQQCSD